jgi:hypothetical protein
MFPVSPAKVRDYMGNKTHSVKQRHGLISAPNLPLLERGLISIATLLRALYLRLVGIVPCARPAKYVLALHPFVDPPTVNWVCDC